MNALEIKAQLENLLTRVTEMEKEKGTYVFTEDQMLEFVKLIHDEFIKGVKTNIDNMIFDEDLVELELDYNRQIEVTVDSDRIKDEVMNEINTDVYFDDFKILVDNTYQTVKL